MGGVGSPDPRIGVGWVEGWLDWQTTTRKDNTNTEFLTSDKYANLGPYIGRQKNILKCPADNYLSPKQRAYGWTARVRSFSGNIGVGEGNATEGPWDAIYQHYTKYSQMIYPGPAATWVFVDEHPDSMNDAGFFNPRISNYLWVDMPATYHNGACGFAFADGHSEIHKWKGPTMNKPRANGGLRGVNFQWQVNVPTVKGDPDLSWLSYATPRKETFHY